MEVLKTAIDECRTCGRSIYRGQGCPMDFLCDDCDPHRAAPSPSKPSAPRPVKESSMSSTTRPFRFGQFIPGDARLYRQERPDSEPELVTEAELAALSLDVERQRVEADAARTPEGRLAAAERARIEAEASLADAIAQKRRIDTEAALQKAGIIPRVCRRCGGGYESSIERLCNGCVGKGPFEKALQWRRPTPGR